MQPDRGRRVRSPGRVAAAPTGRRCWRRPPGATSWPAFLAAAEAQGLHPRALYRGAGRLPRAVPGGAAWPSDAAAPPPAARSSTSATSARTSASCGDGNAMYARTIRRGGAHLTAAIAKAFGADLERAEQAKRGEAFLASPGRPATIAAAGQAGRRAARGAGAHRPRAAADPGQLRGRRRSRTSRRCWSRAAAGGWRGCCRSSRRSWAFPPRYPSVRDGRWTARRQPRRSDDEAPATSGGRARGRRRTRWPAAIALAAARGSREIDFRRGRRSCTAPTSRSCARRPRTWRRWRPPSCWPAGIDVGAKLSSLRTERKALDKELKTATQELFGKPRDDAEAVTQLLRKGFREELAPLPKATAFDLLDQISRKVPPADKVKLDVAELEIRPKKTFIKGTVDTAARRRRDRGQDEGDRLLRGRHEGRHHRSVRRRQAVHPQRRDQVPMTRWRARGATMSAKGSRARAAATLARPMGYLQGRVGAAGAAPEALADDLGRRRRWWPSSSWAPTIAISDIADLEEGNAAIRDALAAIAKHRDEYLEAKARNAVQEARIGNDPPQLAGDLEAAARAENIQIAESSERPTRSGRAPLRRARHRPQDSRGRPAEPDEVHEAGRDRTAARSSSRACR